MLRSESLFVSTGAEMFVRRTFFNLLPLCPPLLRTDAFVAMRRATLIFDGK